MANDIELAAFGHRADKVRLIAQGIYNTEERLALIAFVSEAEKLAAELVASKRHRTNATEPRSKFARAPAWSDADI